MSLGSANQATVRVLLSGGKRKRIPEALSALDNTCAAGQTCSAVQSSATVKPTLDALVQAVEAAHTSLSKKQALIQQLLAAIKTLTLDFQAVKLALRAYEAGVNVLANGDASLINQAGLLSRSRKIVPAILDKVLKVNTRPGKHPTEAIISWPRAPGATGYAIEVNYTPGDPTGPWTALRSGAGRRRVVKTPVPASQLLVRVAALDSHGTQTDWSDAILATTL